MSRTQNRARYGPLRSGQLWVHIKDGGVWQLVCRATRDRWTLSNVDRRGGRLNRSHKVKEDVVYTKFRPYKLSTEAVARG